MTSLPHAQAHGFVFGLAGLANSGKTTLAEKLIASLSTKGFRVASIKHAHHGFEADTPDKDSWRHRKAGARETIISSSNRRVKFTELHNEDEASLDTLLSELSVADFVLVEGYKSVDFPKIEIWRSDLDSPFLYETHPGIRMIASDIPLTDCPLPRLDLNDTEAITKAVIGKLNP